MATLELTAQNFETTIEGNNIVIIDFWADWCGPCKRFAPIFEESSEKHTEVCFAKVNTEEQQELAGHFGIRSIPTIIIFREQIGIYQQSGALPPEALDELIGQIKELDMDTVRAEIKANQEKGE
tara:strand:- start:386 stop:757 length:372 start_codon:yes stop_codon:yes gene_type:complete